MPRITVEQLALAYRGTLRQVEAGRLTSEAIARSAHPILSRKTQVVAIGKCAAEMASAADSLVECSRLFLACPGEYWKGGSGKPSWQIALGTHPHLSSASFDCGRKLLDFVQAARDPIVFLISGGGSACVESPLVPWFREGQLVSIHDALLRSGLAIALVNTVRKHLSSIKGGRLGRLAPAGSHTFILSDVSTGRLADVASGPTLADPTSCQEAAELLFMLGDSVSVAAAKLLLTEKRMETPKQLPLSAELVADNSNLVAAAAKHLSELGLQPGLVLQSVEGTVAEAADRLFEAALQAGEGDVLVAGGEPTVPRMVSGGKGGRCSEMAVRFARRCLLERRRLPALFGSSDGIDGSTGFAAFLVDPARLDASGVTPEEIDRALDTSNSLSVAERVGAPIHTDPTGNNLRDLFLIGREWLGES